MISQVDYQALAEFRHQIRRFLAFSEREARAAGLESQQHQLLLAIKGLPKGQRPTIGTLAERLQVRHHSAVELVNRLVERRLATRRRSDSDGREVLIQVTARGEQLLRRLSLAHKDELRSIGPSLVRALEAIIPEPIAVGRGASWVASACARSWARWRACCTSLDSSASSGGGASLGAGAALGSWVTFDTRGGAFGLGGLDDPG